MTWLVSWIVKFPPSAIVSAFDNVVAPVTDNVPCTIAFDFIFVIPVICNVPPTFTLLSNVAIPVIPNVESPVIAPDVSNVLCNVVAPDTFNVFIPNPINSFSVKVAFDGSVTVPNNLNIFAVSSYIIPTYGVLYNLYTDVASGVIVQLSATVATFVVPL